MVYANTATVPISKEVLEMMEAHRRLIQIADVAQESDTYSLAQPSPFRFVPSVASNQTPNAGAGE